MSLDSNSYKEIRMDFFTPPERGMLHVVKPRYDEYAPFEVNPLAKAMERALSETPLGTKVAPISKELQARPEWLQTFSE